MDVIPPGQSYGLATLRPVLTAEQTRMLDQYYKNGQTLEDLALEFECSIATVVAVRDSHAGENYALSLVRATRARINLTAARVLEDRLTGQMLAGISTETIVKLYGASLPKDVPTPGIDQVYAEANRLMKKHNLTIEQRDRLVRIGLGEESLE